MQFDSRMARTNYPGGGLFIVENDVNLLLTTMRRGVKWSSHSHQEEEQNGLIKGLTVLKKDLNNAKSLAHLDPAIYLAPFLEIIRSETTGTVTSLALSAVNKIISYGIIDPNHPTISHYIQTVADAVTHATFVSTDASSDGIVFMRVLQVLRTLVLSPLGDHLSNERILDILLNCFKICFDRQSDLVRKTAEHCLKDIVQHLFLKLPHFKDDSTKPLDMEFWNTKKMRTTSMDNTRSKSRKNKSHSKPKKISLDETNVEDGDRSVITSPVDAPKNSILATTPTTDGEIVQKNSNENKTHEENNAKLKFEEEPKSPVSSDLGDGNHISATENNMEKHQESRESQENVVSESFVDNPDHACLEKQEFTCKSEIGSPAGSVEDLSASEMVNSMDSSKLSKVMSSDQREEYVNAQGVRFTPLQPQGPYGSVCIRELFSFLVTICQPLDKTNTEVMIQVGLSLLQEALEISADAISKFSSLLAIAKDQLCRNLIWLLNHERSTILATTLQVAFLLFEAQREHLKFQMEQYITKLMDIVNLDSTKTSYEQRELALEALVRLWKIPGLPAELYINYDCGLYSSNLYEELMKLLSETVQNDSVVFGSMYSLQFISLDALVAFISEMEKRSSGKIELLKMSRHNSSQSLPTREQLHTIKAEKHFLTIGTEKFNEPAEDDKRIKRATEGIEYLVNQGILREDGENPKGGDPKKIAIFLRENPALDKKVIGEYLCKKKNAEILKHFVETFDFKNMRIDQALRLYLEAFRLPGESALIELLVDKFASHWHISNGTPFHSHDTAYILTYAIIMLNVDQHNHKVKSIPMTPEDFKRNVSKINKGEDVDQDMLDEIYSSIKEEEIVMPAEQTGLVKEDYLWKVLLRRGMGPEGVFLQVGNEGKFIDRDLAEQAWPQIISALCRAYDKAPDRSLQQRIAQSFVNCAAISDHYNMSSDLDTLIVSLCKFTGLALGGEPDEIALHLGESGRRQLAVHTLFKIVQLHGHTIRESWKNIINCLRMLFKARLLPKNITEGEDFLDPSGKVTLPVPTSPKPQSQDQGLMSSLFSYITDSARTAAQKEMAKKKAEKCVNNCHLQQIIEESKFLLSDSLQSLVGALVSVSPRDEDISVFLLEILLRVTIENRDRVACIWPVVQGRLDGLLTTATRENQPFLLERVSIGMLRLAIRLLRSEEFACTVLPPLIPLTYLPSIANAPLCRQIAYGLFELLKTGAANIHSTEDWQVIFSLLECTGAGALRPKPSTVQDEAKLTRTSILEQNAIPEWVLVSPTGTEAPLPVAADVIVLDRDLKPHDPAALVKCCESLTFLVRDVAHVTPFNFELCVRCVRTFAEAVLQTTGRRLRVQGNIEDVPAYQQSPIQLLDLMHTLHTRTAQVFKWWADEGNTVDVSLWLQAWKPLLQGIARLCCDSRRPVRSAAIAYLQSTLLAHDLAQLTAVEWSQCLEQVLFPLLAQLLGPISANDPTGVEETRVRAAMLLSKVFLHHLTPLLTLSEFLPLWLTVLDLLRAYMHADNSELLFEAIPESLKNMLLVMASAGVLAPDSNLWAPTWRTIDSFLPGLKGELFPEPAPSVSPPVISLVDQEQPGAQQPGLVPVVHDEEAGNPVENHCQDLSLGQKAEEQVVESVKEEREISEQAIVREEPMEQVQVVIHNEMSCQSSPEVVEEFRGASQWQNQQQYSLQSQEGLIDVAGIIRANSEISNPSTTTMFNSAAYFSEDPSADRLFVVTNP